MEWQLEIRLDRNDRPGFYRHLQPNADDSTGIRYCGKVALVKCKVGFRDSINLSLFSSTILPLPSLNPSHGDKLVTCYQKFTLLPALAAKLLNLNTSWSCSFASSTVTVRNNLIYLTLPCSWRNSFLWDTCSDGRLVKEFSSVSRCKALSLSIGSRSSTILYFRSHNGTGQVELFKSYSHRFLPA